MGTVGAMAGRLLTICFAAFAMFIDILRGLEVRGVGRFEGGGNGASGLEELHRGRTRVGTGGRYGRRGQKRRAPVQMYPRCGAGHHLHYRARQTCSSCNMSDAKTLLHMSTKLSGLSVYWSYAAVN